MIARSAEKRQQSHEHEIVIASRPFDLSEGEALSDKLVSFKGSNSVLEIIY